MPIQSRRNAIKHILKLLEREQWCATHAGLWFDKYMPEQLKKGETVGDKPTPQKQLVDEVHKIGVPEAYRHFFNRWEAQITTMPVAIDGCEYRVLPRKATTQGRIAIGLGDESVIETAVKLHHTYGVPYLPGSALKGLAATYAHRYLECEGWRKKGDYHTALFGTTKTAGYVTFFDALYVPDSGKTSNPLSPDVITVHHKAYYENQKGKAPADWDSPTPVPFLTATGTYLVALGGPFLWVEVAFEILGRALKELGIGAKTSSGYGRLVCEEAPVTIPLPGQGTTTTPPIPDPPKPVHFKGKVVRKRGAAYVVQVNNKDLERLRLNPEQRAYDFLLPIDQSPNIGTNGPTPMCVVDRIDEQEQIIWMKRTSPKQ